MYLNGAQTEYPLHKGDLYGWRKYHTVNFASSAGLLVHCHPSLEVCGFQLSGFYFGKTRGLLGTINNEQYDDFTLPSGHVSILRLSVSSVAKEQFLSKYLCVCVD